MRSNWWLSVAGLVVAVVVAAAPTARAGKETPIRMTGTIVASDSPDLTCRGFRGTNNGRLSGAPLGRATWTDHHCGDALAAPGLITVRDVRFVLAGARG